MKFDQLVPAGLAHEDLFRLSALQNIDEAVKVLQLYLSLICICIELTVGILLILLAFLNLFFAASKSNLHIFIHQL